ncbi:exonuclease domain-containing protein [Mesonia sp. K7]|uniref:exonuclease domain-containing protein n=1 Tax=Mesonia sp. K7 TaxID=2218606 RepID=UPI000DA76781|nr:exonuclease domain-containing protein [Mesonia sp. K7]PZD79707.1 exonuclease [Mesonia sp. K7]
MYAILDIETTGGKYNEEGITEIAIYKHDGREVVDQFISLVNPERPIQEFVVGLTGINNAMLRNAPKFYEVAKRIVEITQDCTIVAHNAKFDYRILQLEFDRLGFDFESNTICTVELSKKLIPNVPSYSLGKLVKTLGIPITNRHRASGDAMATVKLFDLLLQKDDSKEIITNSIRKTPKRHLDKKLLKILETLPTDTGVYYFHNEKGDIIYIGKSKNIKKRINQHFTNESKKAKQMQREVNEITYELTGNDLIAMLKESNEIKKNKPIYNRALKRDAFTYALKLDKNQEGYFTLEIVMSTKAEEPLTAFTNMRQAKKFVENLADEYGLCLKLCHLQKTKSACFHYNIKLCEGACIQEETAESYNQRVEKVIEKYSYLNKNLVLIGRGRKNGEKSILLIENGTFQGYGFFELNHQINDVERLKHHITPMHEDRDTKHIILGYMQRKQNLQIKEF